MIETSQTKYSVISLRLILYIQILCFLVLPVSFINAQYQSVDNHSGTWLDSTSWVANIAPETSINSEDVEIYGELFANYCLSFNLNTITVFDTLIMHGNLELKNTSKLVVNKNSVLILLGDYSSNNKVDVINEGIIVVAGKFEMLGDDSKGSFINTGKFFLFDTTPEIKEGKSYLSISCTVNESGDTVCGYKNYDELILDSIFAYYSSLPYDMTGKSFEGNPCQVLDFELSKSELCKEEVITVVSNSVGITKPENLIWNFGQNAKPEKATGEGPHEIYYTTSGIKTIELSDTELPDEIISKQLTVNQLPDKVQFLLADSLTEVYGSYLDTVCIGELTNLFVKGNESQLFNWIIPVLNIDTLTNNSMSTEWNVNPYDYRVAVREISVNGCIGEPSEAYVVVKECIEHDILSETTYAFTPNNDGYNDFWVINDIENYPLAKISVYSRNGMRVFYSEAYYKNDWDGKVNGEVLSVDSYFFIIDLSAYQKGMVRGIVTLIHE
jgi:gliding motility-associated-like protein